jgi:colicin import membrane protein
MGAADPQVTERPLVATLVMTPALAADLAHEGGALEEAKTYVIDSPEMAQSANVALQDVKRRLKVVEEWYERFTAPLRQLQTTATEFFGPPRTALKAAEAHLKNALQEYQTKEQRRIADERRQAEETARKARDEAERKAAAERARAEAAAEESRRKAAEAAAREEAARAAGNARAVAAAAAARAKAEAEAQQRLAEGERKANEAQLAAAALPVAQVTEATKLVGFSTRENYVAELADGKTEDDAKLLVIQAVASGRQDLAALLSLDLKSANKLAKALKTNFNVPGLKAVNKPVAASRSA